MLSSQNTTNYRIPLSPYAKVFYDEWLIEPQSYRYNMVCADHVLTGALDPQRLQSALRRYVADHLLLNSHIQLVGTTPYWCRNDSIDTLDGPEITPSHEALFDFVTHPFDLHQGPLYRFKLIQVSDQVHRLIIVLHHLVMDGISLNDGLFNTLSLYYNDPNYRIPLSLSEQIKQLSTFQDQCHTDLQAHQTALESFWKEQLMAVEPLDLRFLTRYQITEKDPSAPFENPIKEIRFELKNVQKQALQTIKAQYQISPYFFSQCLFALVLHRYTQQTDFAICYPISIQSGADFTFGGQVNLTLMPYRFTPDMQPCDLLKQVRTTLDAIKNHPIRSSYYLISDLIESNQCKPLLTGYFAQTLFRDALFNFENMTSVEALQGLSVDGVAPDRLLIENDPSRPNSYRLKYDSRTLDEGLIHRFIDCYQRVFQDVLEDLLEGTHKKIVDYPLLTQEQTKAILALGQGPAIKPASEQETLHKRFEEKAAQFPNHIALVCENRKLSYQALNEQANQLAHYLKDCYSIEPDDRVMLCLEKNEQLVIAILAVLKSSAAYVPVSGDYPDHRIAFLLKDVAPKCVILSQNYSAKFKDTTNLVVLDDQKTQQAWSKQSKDNPLKSAKGHHLAYIIYTSGTTGQPKGVMQTHYNLLTLLSGSEHLYCFSNRDVWVWFHASVFDVSVWELFGALLYAGRLIIPTKTELRNSQQFHDLCYREKVTLLSLTPATLHNFILSVEKNKEKTLSCLKYVITGGEKLSSATLFKWFKLYPERKPTLVNVYGVTEAAVISTYGPLKKEDALNRMSFIGRPLPGRSAYVLDGKQRPVPLGAIGELFLGGGIARGYLGKSKLTQSRFIKNPFKNSLNPVVYKTGDRVKLLPEGDMEYIDRRDTQIKMRGYRIELSEVENVLLSYSLIEQGKILLKTEKEEAEQDSRKYIVAYYVALDKINTKLLKSHFLNHLPEYMCPQMFVQLDKFPTTINGKIDLSSLPNPVFKSEKKYVAPSNQQEEIVCQFFSESLNLAKMISIHDDFFELGGDSIKAIRLTLQLQDYFEIEVGDIFELRSPQNIAKNKFKKPASLLKRLQSLKNSLEENLTGHSNEKDKQAVKNYLSRFKHLNDLHFSSKPIVNVLLTGATGYLGCNILQKLLEKTHYTVYVLVRGENKNFATERITKKFQFYFGENLIDKYRNRVFIIKGDLEQYRLGLSNENYSSLFEIIDSVIHAAALVKHYAQKKDFYTANVESTKHLLEFTRLTKLKDFHYISTSSVAYFETDSCNLSPIFTEYDFPDPKSTWSNLYNETKYLGEILVIKARDNGIKGHIYRVGNLAFISHNLKTQENIADNAFFNRLCCFHELGCIPDILSKTQISKVDLTAEAIVILFDKQELINETHHVFNPESIDLFKLYKFANVEIQNVSLDQFIEHIAKTLDVGHNSQLIQKFLLHEEWLSRNHFFNKYQLKILQDKTQNILTRLNFEWPTISREQLKFCISKVKQLGQKEYESKT